MKLLVMIAMIFGLQIANAKNIMLKTYNVCTIDGEVDGYSMQQAKLCLFDQVIKRKGRNYPIYLYINSPGGSVYDGIKFIEFAKTIKNLHTVTSFAASMAAAIVEQLPGKRYVVESGIFMFHRASGSVSGQIESGEIEVRLKFWKDIIKQSEQNQADRIGITLKQYKDNIINEWWLYGTSNIEQGVADEVVSVTCSSKLASDVKTETVNDIFGTYEIKTSKCPLLN